MNLKNIISLKSLTNLLFYFSILFFIIGFNFSDTMVGNWYQQFLPSTNGEPISDITFLDSLTGFAVTGDALPNDSNYILKTTNGGDDWVIKYRAYRDFYRIKFINQNTGFACGGFNSIGQGLFKTTNAGENWSNINAPGSIWFEDISVLNEDTIWLVQGSSGDGGVFRTNNGGGNWQQQGNFGSSNPSHIYMYNARIGFIDGLKKTTDGGANWITIAGEPSIFFDMYFADSLLGWKCHQQMKKTTNGGLTWINQILPTGSNIVFNYMLNFSNLNKDTIWGTGGVINFGGAQSRGMLFRTTNGGDNWLYQVPDTAINIFQYSHIQFINKRIGWAYAPSSGIHTLLGGDTNFLIGVQQISNEVPKDFELKQNYPNPFNPRTVIPFSLKKAGHVKLYAYDILGRFTDNLVDGKYSAGEYETDFMGKFAPSGVYFYRLTVDDIVIDTKKMVLVK